MLRITSNLVAWLVASRVHEYYVWSPDGPLPQHLHQIGMMWKDIFRSQEDVVAMWKACLKRQVRVPALHRSDSARGASAHPEP